MVVLGDGRVELAGDIAKRIQIFLRIQGDTKRGEVPVRARMVCQPEALGAPVDERRHVLTLVRILRLMTCRPQGVHAQDLDVG